ncbi:MAG: sigma-70 family RNA polymerase sigma factor [Limisphaerales bacterium]
MKEKTKRDARSHAPAKAHAPAHDDSAPARSRHDPSPATDEDEDNPRNRIANNQQARDAQPRSKRHHQEEPDESSRTSDESEIPLPVGAAAETSETSEADENSDEIEPSPEELQAEEATVQAVVGAVPRDEDAGAPIKDRTSYDADTAIKLYLREIGQVKLLTPQEEIDLAAKIKRGDKKAREDMIKANLRLVVKIAHDYEGLGLPLLDLINEGNIGLMKAVERFDPAKGGKLSTYGSWWIKQSIKRALANQSKTIRLPVHLVDKISKMRRTAMRLQEEFGREPTDEELGEELGISASRVSQLRTAAIRPASLDAPIGDDESNNFAEVVQDENAFSPYEELEDKTVTRMLQEMIKTLDPREATILRYRFGLDGGPEKTLEEVGQKFGVTRERVRQIQNIALSKLRKMIEKLEAVQK